MITTIKQFDYDMKFKIFICAIALILSPGSGFARDDAYLQVLKQTISDVNASVDATLKSVQDALEEDEAKSRHNLPGPKPEPEIVRAMFTTGIRDAEPVNDLAELSEPKKLLFFFTELSGMANRSLQHRWYYNNVEVGSEYLTPTTQQWQSFSRMKLGGREGQWVVELIDEADQVILRKELIYLHGRQSSL